ncbi:egg cell-secreted protein 1.1-like [Dendrobium catenatum]|uniref:Egg cell-secreted protein 1.4 n=1 Tax=Dendrobium catenatum TaxID=906689 RepID=A0A2I0W8I2_9ASPA|nr:egg cell-secreted protein 1.1-like [Dendrobium catenatum]PKU71978.1 Egg cell-secreted protein 1.4 [Dendrobium catenatum]
MAKYYSSATFVILLLIAAAMTAPQTASSYLTGESLFRCWEAVHSLEGCVAKLVAPEALNIHLRLTPRCCVAIKEIGENCLSTIYPSFAVAPSLGSLLDGICADYLTPAPQPAASD